MLVAAHVRAAVLNVSVFVSPKFSSVFVVLPAVSFGPWASEASFVAAILTMAPEGICFAGAGCDLDCLMPSEGQLSDNKCTEPASHNREGFQRKLDVDIENLQYSVAHLKKQIPKSELTLRPFGDQDLQLLQSADVGKVTVSAVVLGRGNWFSSCTLRFFCRKVLLRRAPCLPVFSEVPYKVHH